MKEKRPTRSLPSGLAVARQIAGLSLRRARRSRLLRVAALLMLLPSLAALAGVISGQSGAQFFQSLAKMHIAYLAPLVLALLSSLSLAEEVQNKTITYLFSRPIARWSLPMGKYMGMVIVALALMSLSLVVCYLLALLPEGAEVLSELPALALSWVAVALSVLYFAALASAFGAMVTNAPFAVMLVYVLAVDVGMSFMPHWIKAVSMTVHLQALAGIYAGTDGYLTNDPELIAAIALPVVCTMTVIWVAVAVGVSQSAEFKSAR